MVNRNLLRQYDLPEDELQHELGEIFNHGQADWLPAEAQEFRDHRIVIGRVRKVNGDEVCVDVGYKSEGTIELREWFDDGLGEIVPPRPGDQVEVLIEAVEDDAGTLVLSYRKARRQKEWDLFIGTHKEGDVVSGPVTRKIKGGLLVNIGVSAFLPASQIDTRRVADIGLLLGKSLECKILIIDQDRRSIVVSRRRLIEDHRLALKTKLLSEIAPGQVRKGVVKNILRFGAFVDLGGLDGLLHVTDMSWGRVNDPGDLVQIDQEIEVYVLKVDQEHEKIALSLKHLTPSPWLSVEAHYPVGSRHTGEIVNVMPYGAFVQLEPGVEGLVHISEMSWTKRLDHPSELVAPGDSIEVQVLAINQQKQEISLGIKQVQSNPWDGIAEKYPPGTQVEGTVRNLSNYGAFIEVEEGVDGLLHVSDLSWVRKVNHPSEMLSKDDKVKCVVLSVDQDRKRIALGLKQMGSDPWEGDIPRRYHPGDVKKGKVTKLTNFGVFVELEPGLEGLIHISQLADQKVDKPEEVVQVGDAIEVRVLRVDVPERKLGLTRRQPSLGDEETGDAAVEGAPRGGQQSTQELRGGIGSDTGQLFTLPNAASPLRREAAGEKS
jgi:small subunit ribosomal protein S1